MDSNKKLIKDKIKKYKNQLVLDGFNVVLLEGFAEDTEDYYYIYLGERGRYWSSCVGAFIPLKDFLPKKIYESLKYVFGLNKELFLMRGKQEEK